MLFSLIISTKDRTSEMETVLRSLQQQTLQDFQIIVSDQNPDDRIVEFLHTPEWTGRLIHLKSSGGISGARNAGLAHANGEIIAFPDDDCAYPPRLLEDVAAFFAGHPEYGFLSGRSVAPDGGDAATRHHRHASPIHRDSIHAQCIEFAFFVRRSSLGSLRFDENMGVGGPTPWQADEGPDLMLRLMARGEAGYYEPQIVVRHPRPVVFYDEKAIDRSYRYACGFGYFLRKHRYPLPHVARSLFRTCGGCVLACLALNGGKARFYVARLRGTWRGWRHGKSAAP